MADIRPFRAYRPRAGMEQEIAALPYDVYDRAEARAEVEKNPRSFLAIDRAETWFSPDTDIYAPMVYEKARQVLWREIEEGWFLREEKPCFYLYQQEMNGRKQTGIAACASIDDYVAQVIRKHENTRADKEEDRIRHVDVCDMQTGPIFLAYRSCPELKAVIKEVLSEEPVYDFTAQDGISHRVWVISQQDRILRIQECFRQMDRLYIADGHHRCASAVKVGLMRRERSLSVQKALPSDYFLSVLFDQEELQILDYNRVVKDLNGLDTETFLERVQEVFTLQKMGRTACRPQKKGELGMYLDGQWYLLTVREALQSSDPVKGLDVSILQDCLLEPVLGICDPKTDQRIAFVGGIRGLSELERRVDTDCRVAFALYPTSLEELFAVADEGRLMPPKSTWFEPKLRSGLLLHSLREEDASEEL